MKMNVDVSPVGCPDFDLIYSGLSFLSDTHIRTHTHTEGERYSKNLNVKPNIALTQIFFLSLRVIETLSC